MSALNAIDVAAAHLDGLRALAADAAETLDGAARARTAGEIALATAEEGHNAAIAKSAADRTDDSALDACSRASLRRDHAARDHREAVAAHGVAKAEHEAVTVRVVEAERTLSRLRLEAKLLDPNLSAEQQERGRKIVDTIKSLIEQVQEAHASLLADAADVARARELGATVEAADGIQIASGLAFGILAHGGCVAADDHTVRHVCDVREYNGRIAEATRRIVEFVCSALGRPSVPPTLENVEALRRQADVFSSHRSFLGASRAIEAQRTRERQEQRASGVGSGEKAYAERVRLGLVEPSKGYSPNGRYVPPDERQSPRRAPAMQTFRPRDEELPDGSFSRDELGRETPDARVGVR
jgi:hypothetical protein